MFRFAMQFLMICKPESKKTLVVEKSFCGKKYQNLFLSFENAPRSLGIDTAATISDNIFAQCKRTLLAQSNDARREARRHARRLGYNGERFDGERFGETLGRKAARGD